MANTQEFPRGQLSTVILMCLKETDKYGYEIIEEVLKKTNGALSIKQPSLYSSLKRMEEQSLISSYWRDSEIGGRRHYYHLTDLGKKHLEKWQTNITLPSPDVNSPSVNITNLNETKVLQQENLFNITKESSTTSNLMPQEEMHDNSFVQFNLFTNNQIITPPDTSKSIEEQNKTLDNQISIIDSLEAQKQNLVVNTSETPKPPVIQKFDFIKKSNKSFAESIKNINSVENKKYIEKQTIISVPNTEMTTAESLICSSNSIQNSDDIKDQINELNQAEETINNNLEQINNAGLSSYNSNIDSSIVSETETLENMPKISISNLQGYNSNLSQSTIIKQTTDNLANNANSVIDKNEEIKDDGVLITERLDIKDLPKQPKFEARKFEVYISDDSLTPKFRSKDSENYEDRVKALYEKSKLNAENQELELIDSKIKFSSYKDLEQFYSEQNIKFKPYQKTLYKSEKNFDMIKISKLNMLTSLCLFGAISLITLIFGIIFSSFKNIYLNSPITYLILPLLSLLIFGINFIAYQKSPQKRVAFDVNKFKFNYSTLILSLLIIPLVIAINILFGFNFKNFSEYSLSILYPLTLSLIYVIYYITQKILSKSKKLY